MSGTNLRTHHTNPKSKIHNTECGGAVTKSLKDAALVLAPEGEATAEWMRATLEGEGAGASGAAKAKAQALRALLDDHACVKPAWLFDAVDQAVVPEERSEYALQAPGVGVVASMAAAAVGGPANEEEEAE